MIIIKTKAGATITVLCKTEAREIAMFEHLQRNLEKIGKLEFGVVIDQLESMEHII